MRYVNLRSWGWMALMPMAFAACGTDDDGDPAGNPGTGAQGGTGGSGNAAGADAGLGGGALGGSGGSTGGSAGAAGNSGGAAGNAAAGGSGGAVSLDCKKFASESAASACASYATAFCELTVSCQKASLDLWALGSQADCVSRYSLWCEQFLTAPGSQLQPALFAANAEWLKGLSCDELYAGALGGGEVTLPPECGSVAGTAAEGQACYVDSQCMSECQSSAGACGTCAAPGGLGASCVFDDDCANGLRCDANDECAPVENIGESCLFSSECADGSYCGSSDKCEVQGGAQAPCSGDPACESPLVCGSNGLCKTPSLGGTGASCELSETMSCNGWMGLECDGATQKCVLNALPKAGEACGWLINDGGGATFVAFCSGGAKCVIPENTNAGTCMKPAGDGAACDDESGPPCQFPASCVQGKCAIADANLCK